MDVNPDTDTVVGAIVTIIAFLVGLISQRKGK